MKKRLAIQTNHADPAYAERRLWCRASWLSDAGYLPNLRWTFYGGDGNHNIPSDTLVFDVKDGKRTCSDRHRLMCQWVLNDEEWDWLVKCDDDSYVHLPRLAAYEPTGDFGGMVIPEDGKGAGGYPSGALVWYSRKAAQIIADELPGGYYADDQQIGLLLGRHGIKPVHEPRIHSWLDWSLNTPVPRPENDVICTHAVRTWQDHYRLRRIQLGIEA